MTEQHNQPTIITLEVDEEPTHMLIKFEQKHGGEPGFAGFRRGQVVNDDDGTWVVIAANQDVEYDHMLEEELISWTAYVRPATAAEVAA